MAGATPFTTPDLIAELRGLYTAELPHLCDIVAPRTETGPNPTRVRSGLGWAPAPIPDGDDEAPAPGVTSGVPCLFIEQKGDRRPEGDALREAFDAIIELSPEVEVTAKHTFRVDGKEYLVVALDNHRPNSLRQRIKVKDSTSGTPA